LAGPRLGEAGRALERSASRPADSLNQWCWGQTLVKQLFIVILGLGLCVPAAARPAETSQPLKLVQTIDLPGVQGRIDHQSVDVKGKRYFLGVLGTGTVVVVDLATGKVIHTITGLNFPQGVLYVPETNRIFVDDGGLNACKVYDGSSYQLIRTVSSIKDADDIRYDSCAARTNGFGVVEVGYGEATEGGIRVLDSRNGMPLADLPGLPGHAESFQVEKCGSAAPRQHAGWAARGGPYQQRRRIFVNVPSAGVIAVLDPGRRVIVAQWPVKGVKAFFPMALDDTDHRLFVGGRNPPKLLVFDTETGKLVASVDGLEETDDLYYDAAHKRVYMSAGEGAIGVFAQRDADHYSLVAKIPSVPGAGTSLFVPELNRLYVPAPPYGGKPARVLVYEVEP
jgi:hypothetical protein